MLNLKNIHKFHTLEHTSVTFMTIQTVSISKKASKVKGDSQAAWLRFQEVQVLHQLQADRAYQECPAGWREGGEGQLSGLSLEWKWNTLLLQSASAMTKMPRNCLCRDVCAIMSLQSPSGLLTLSPGSPTEPGGPEEPGGPVGPWKRWEKSG